MDTTGLELEILELEEKAVKTRDVVEKANFESRIALLKQQIRKANDENIEKEPVFQKDVPVRLDHEDKDAFHTGRQITDTGNTFKVLL